MMQECGRIIQNQRPIGFDEIADLVIEIVKIPFEIQLLLCTKTTEKGYSGMNSIDPTYCDCQSINNVSMC